MKKRSVFARRCSIETLEDRRLMASDVFARIDRGNLIIRGDDAANAIAITAGAVAGQVVVTGVNDGNGLATRVNGASNGAATLNGFTGRIEFEMRGGNDNVTATSLTSRGMLLELGRGNDNINFTDQTVRGDLVIRGGDGDEDLFFQNKNVDGSLTVDLGEGNNRYESRQGHVGRDAKFFAGRGNDSFELLSTQVAGTLFACLGDGQNGFSGINLQANRVEYKGGKNADTFYLEVGGMNWVTVDVGQGDNRVDLHAPFINRDLRVTCGNGDDVVIGDENPIGGNAKIDLGDGNNDLRFLMDVKGDFTIRGGRGTDSVTLDGQFNSTPIVYRSLEVELGEGTNTLNVSDIGVAREAEFEGGDGNDAFNWTNCQFRSFQADLGDGNNSIHFASNTVQRDAGFNTGDGNDTGEIAGSTIIGNTKVRLGNGNNGLFYLNNSNFHGDVAIRGGNGSDLPSFYLVHIFGSLKVDFGGGGNRLFIQAASVDGRAEFLGGNDVDNFEINFLSSASLNVAMGKGNDELRISSTSTTGLARFDGGDGQDSFLVATFLPNSFATFERKSFEIDGVYFPT